MYWLPDVIYLSRRDQSIRVRGHTDEVVHQGAANGEYDDFGDSHGPESCSVV